jgi:hypothetical protein
LNRSEDGHNVLLAIDHPHGLESSQNVPHKRSFTAAVAAAAIERLYRHLHLAVCMIAMGLAACSTTPASLDQSKKLHLRAETSDFTELGIGTTIDKREDGRRTPQSSEFFEWWYFDGLLDAGTVIVVWFGDSWLYGKHKRTVSIEVTPPGGPTRKVLNDFDDAGTFARDHAAIHIGSHSLEGDLDNYSIHVDAAAAGGVGCDLQLHRRVPSYRPATGHIAAGDKFFAWLVAVPEGDISGTFTLDNVARKVTGSGYHDHNWGNVSPSDIFDNWWWGRGLVGSHTVIASVIRAKPSVGGNLVPLLLVGDERATGVNAYGDDLRVSEGDAVRHPDPKHERSIGSSIALSMKDGTEVRFNTSRQLLTSSDLLEDKGLAIRLAARALGMHPWYTRFISPLSLKPPGKDAMTGSGTLEYFEMK